MGLNIIIQKNGAHTETIPMFVELLSSDCKIFYPTLDSNISYEDAIKERYDVAFIKGGYDLHLEIERAINEHGLMIFNTANEMKQEWAKPFLSKWRGRVVVYHHEADRFEDPNLIQFYAHPFIERGAYLLPVSTVFDSYSNAIVVENICYNIVLPNWSRPTQLANKNSSFMSRILNDWTVKNGRILMTGMSTEVMSEMLSKYSQSERVEILHRKTFSELRDLLLCNRSYILPLIKPAGRYDRLGLTGSIPLALNHGCPLVVTADIADKYDIRMFVEEECIFDQHYFSNEIYKKLRNDTLSERNRIIKSNKDKFSIVLEQNSVTTQV